MTSVVVDASIALKWVLNEELSPEADVLYRTWRERNDDLIVPDIFLYEVAHVLYRQQRSGAMRLEQSWLAFLGIRARVAFRPPIPRITYRAFVIGNATGRPDTYDAHYAALAELEGCEYRTADERFWNAVRAMLPSVRWLGEVR